MAVVDCKHNMGGHWGIKLQQIDSILRWISSVIDDRWHQNVVRKKTWLSRCSWVCHWWSYHILISSPMCFCTGPWKHGVNFFCNSERTNLLMVISFMWPSSSRLDDNQSIGSLYSKKQIPFCCQCLLSNRSQALSKCGKTKKSFTKGKAKSVFYVLTTFWNVSWSITEKAQGHMEFICFIWWISNKLAESCELWHNPCVCPLVYHN